MKKAKTSSPVKHIPQRTCVACQKTSGKRELVRLVRLPDGSVQVDSTGKKSGRGAYLCPSRECWVSALKTGKIEHTLRTGIKPKDKQRLTTYAEEIDKGQ